MKRGVECYPDYDSGGRWCLKISKKKGRLSLDDIREAAREWEWDFYLLVLDCFHDPDDLEQFGEVPEGDLVTLYRTDLLNEEE